MSRSPLRPLAVACCVAMLQSGCVDPSGPPRGGGSASVVATDQMDVDLQTIMVRVNDKLAASGAAYRMGRAQWVGANSSGRSVLFKLVGGKSAAFRWMSGDPRRGGRAYLTYAVDQVDGAPGGPSTGATTAAIDRAVGTWNSLACGHIPITRMPNQPGVELGVVRYLLGMGGSPAPAADFTHAGWLPGSIVAGDWLGITFTFYFLSDDNRDGKFDEFFAETYYNSDWPWAIDALWPLIDVEAVALHETGHALDLEHYGKLFVTVANGKPHWAPLAVMNPLYNGAVHALQGTDKAGFCGLWAKWPK